MEHDNKEQHRNFNSLIRLQRGIKQDVCAVVVKFTQLKKWRPVMAAIIHHALSVTGKILYFYEYSLDIQVLLNL